MPDATCSIDGCDKPYRSRGWCGFHYDRWRRKGSADWQPPTLAVRFWAEVDRSGGVDACWPRAVDLNHGYGRISIDGKKHLAHRVAWFLTYGEWPAGILDHTCHNGTGCNLVARCPHRSCVNPAHLEEVTHRTNLMRGVTVTARNAARTSCPQGHPYDDENTYVHEGSRHCRICQQAAGRRLRQARKSGA